MIAQAIAANGPNRRQTVSTTSRRRRNGRNRLEAVGSLRRVNGADLSFEVSGVVAEMMFQSGDEVAAARRCASAQRGRRSASSPPCRRMRPRRHRPAAATKAASFPHPRGEPGTGRFDGLFFYANLRNARAQVRQQQAIATSNAGGRPFAAGWGCARRSRQ